MLFPNLFSKRDRDLTQLKKTVNLLILMTICCALMTIGYMLLVHHLDRKNVNSDLSSLSSTRPIEKPRIISNAVEVYNKIEPEKYNEFEVKSRIIREKIERLTNVHERKRNATADSTAPANFTTKNVHIFYSAPVAWYKVSTTNATSSTWLSDSANPSERLNIVFQPLLGTYSLNTKILKKHFQNIKNIGIGVIIITWSPDKSRTDMLKNILNFSKQFYPVDVSICIEIDAYPGRSPESIKSDFEFLHREFIWSHPNLYRVYIDSQKQYLPMIYIKDVFTVNHRDWFRIFSSRGSDTVRKTMYDAVFLGHIRYFILAIKFRCRDGVEKFAG